MRAHLAALKSALTAAGLSVHTTDAGASPTYPFVVLAASSGAPSTDAPLVTGSDLEDIVYVTCSGLTDDSVFEVQRRVRTALAPFAHGSSAVAGRLLWLNLFDSRTVRVDREVTIPNTNRHPAYGVDLYRLTSVPA